MSDFSPNFINKPSLVAKENCGYNQAYLKVTWKARTIPYTKNKKNNQQYQNWTIKNKTKTTQHNYPSLIAPIRKAHPVQANPPSHLFREVLSGLILCVTILSTYGKQVYNMIFLSKNMIYSIWGPTQLFLKLFPKISKISSIATISSNRSHN